MTPEQLENVQRGDTVHVIDTPPENRFEGRLQWTDTMTKMCGLKCTVGKLGELYPNRIFVKYPPEIGIRGYTGIWMNYKWLNISEPATKESMILDKIKQLDMKWKQKQEAKKCLTATC